jgi:hypothetical protein
MRRWMSRLWKRTVRDWPRWAQAGGFLLGLEQVAAWWATGRAPNLGAMTFAGALLMMAQRTVSAQQARNEKRDAS